MAFRRRSRAVALVAAVALAAVAACSATLVSHPPSLAVEFRFEREGNARAGGREGQVGSPSERERDELRKRPFVFIYLVRATPANAASRPFSPEMRAGREQSWHWLGNGAQRCASGGSEARANSRAIFKKAVCTGDAPRWSQGGCTGGSRLALSTILLSLSFIAPKSRGNVRSPRLWVFAGQEMERGT